MGELRRPAVVAGVADHQDVVLRVLKDELDTRGDDVLCKERLLDRGEIVSLHSVQVQVAGDEVTQESKNNAVDLHILAEDFSQSKPSLEILYTTGLGNGGVVLVQTVGLAERNFLTNVPIRGQPHGRALRATT